MLTILLSPLLPTLLSSLLINITTNILNLTLLPPTLPPPRTAAEASDEKLRTASSYIEDLTGKIDQLECELATARHNAEAAISELQTLRGRGGMTRLWLTQSLTDLLSHPPYYSLTDLLSHSIIHPLAHLIVHSPNRSLQTS